MTEAEDCTLTEDQFQRLLARVSRAIEQLRNEKQAAPFEKSNKNNGPQVSTPRQTQPDSQKSLSIPDSTVQELEKRTKERFNDCDIARTLQRHGSEHSSSTPLPPLGNGKDTVSVYYPTLVSSTLPALPTSPPAFPAPPEPDFMPTSHYTTDVKTIKRKDETKYKLSMLKWIALKPTQVHGTIIVKSLSNYRCNTTAGGGRIKKLKDDAMFMRKGGRLKKASQTTYVLEPRDRPPKIISSYKEYCLLRTPDDVVNGLREIIYNEDFTPEITPMLLTMAKTLERAKELQKMNEEKLAFHPCCLLPYLLGHLRR